MSEQNSGSNNRPQNSGGGQNNNNRRHHHNRNRRPQGQGGQGQNQGQQGQQAQQPRQPSQGQQGGQQPRSGSPQGGGGNNHRRRHRGGQNRHRSQGQGHQGQSQQGQGQGGQSQHGINLERLYEKYLNLLDQHLIARRKYHDMFFRADHNQKAKLERNFYNTLNDVREFENKMTPEARELFEKRNNGLKPDTIYTSNHEITEAEVEINEGEIEDPHFLQSQRAADYSGDTEESVGSLDDYLKYKNLV